MARIVAICGSPRKAGTYFMLDEALAAAKAKGASVEIMMLSDLDIGLCRGCASCEKTKACVIEDDMKEIFEKLEASDVILLGSPNYFNNVSGTMKNFMDRTNPLWERGSLSGKKAAFCCVGGQHMKSIQKCADNLSEYIRIMGMDLIGFVQSKDTEIRSKAVLDELKKLGETIAD